jgi:hypothetical protein
MHKRFLPWLLIGVLFASFSLRVHAASGQFKTPGTIKVARVVGKATKTVGGTETELKKEDTVEQSAVVRTVGDKSSLVLAFSNGATTRLGGETELVIDEFLQDPFKDDVRPSKIDAEPTPSRTKLSLNRGELVGDVKTLKLDQDASFTVTTPVGAAGVRGTVFRIVFRPSGTPGQAIFQLTTAAGLVDFGANATASGTAKLDIPQGQEISFSVDVTINAQGQMVVTVLPPPPGATKGVTANTMAEVAAVAVEITGAVATAIFSAPRVPGGPPTGSIGDGRTTSILNTQNAAGTINVTNPQPQNAIPAGQLTSPP